MSITKVIRCLAIIIILSILALSLGCITIVNRNSGPAITGSGNLDTQAIDYSGFTKLNVSHAFQAEIARADIFFIGITLDDNLFEYLDIEKRGDTLYIGLDPNYTYRRSTQRVVITMPDLRGFELSEASKADISGFSSTDSLQLEISEASFMSINDVEAGDTKFLLSGASKVSGSIEITDGNFIVSGASTVELTGSADDISMKVSGASSMNLDDFTVVNATMELSGASDGTINASGRLDADVSGASRLNYIGNPILGSINTSGGSTISKK